MPDQNQTNTTNDTNPPAPAPDPTQASDVVVSPEFPVEAPVEPDTQVTGDSLEIMRNVGEKIGGVHNILVAISSDPSVDELSAAIGLSLCLDRGGKRATAIYSGKTPNVIEFLNPEKTFETTSDVLRDFVISLSKEKADHLRYKLDGDFVKIFITPYKSRIDAEDLEFSYGDFNIELVLALNVSSGIDLDDALREHGRVMHDAVVVNITNGNPGKFGDIEWSDKSKSSISEMVADLLYDIGGKNALEGEEATALLTGIVAATEHFSNNRANATSHQMAARLINSGANRELISENIGLDSQNMFFATPESVAEAPTNNIDDGDEAAPSLSIDHDEDDDEEKIKPTEEVEKEPEEKAEEKVEEKTEEDKEEQAREDTLLADLKAAEASLSHTGDVITPDNSNEPVQIGDSAPAPEPTTVGESSTIKTESVAPTPESPINPSDVIGVSEPTNFEAESKEETVINPTEEFVNENSTTGSSNKYGQMLEEALAEANANEAVPEMNPVQPVESAPQAIDPTPFVPETMTNAPISNPAIDMAPPVSSEPEINGVPEMNYMPMPGDDILPPPPTPPIDLNSPVPTPAPDVIVAPEVTPTPTPTPTPEPTLPAPTEPNPGSFQIPTPTA